VVEGTGLENRQAGDRLVGSNPTPSAKCFSQENDVAMAGNCTANAESGICCISRQFASLIAPMALARARTRGRACEPLEFELSPVQSDTLTRARPPHQPCTRGSEFKHPTNPGIRAATSTQSR
jgi:hypothetical protein